MIFKEDETLKSYAGTDEDGNLVEGTTTGYQVHRIFGDIADGKPVNKETFDKIINRCEAKKTPAWKATWMMWKENKLLT